MLDVTRLRVLVAVARYGSVTAAARALNYAQPSVSHHLARLEAETGTKLIQRAGRGIRLTDAGRLLAERGAEVIGRLDAAENELAAYTGLRAGRLRLAAFPSALGTIVPAAAALLREQQPATDLRLTEAEPPEALRMLRAGYVDMALVFRYSAETPEGTDPGEAPDSGIDLAEGLRERLLLTEPVHAGRVHPEDRLHHRRLHRRAGAGGRRPGGLDPARAVPAGRAASGDQDGAAAGRAPVRARGALRRPARPARGEPAHGGAPHGRGTGAALCRRAGSGQAACVSVQAD
jgi:DNA-binding transcriptional LysR family regulator